MKKKRPRKQKTETLKGHALRLIDEIRKCRTCPPCEHCQDLLFRELNDLLETVEIVLPKNQQK